MPLKEIIEVEPGTRRGLWLIKEPADFFLNKITLTNTDRKQLDSLGTTNRLLEWLASRYLLKLLINPEKVIELSSDEHNKPVILNFPVEVSISHAQNLAAAMVSYHHQVGIDVEQIHQRVERIDKKFLSDAELDSISPQERKEMLTLMWSAKESLYKLYGRRQLDFKEHLKLEPFEIKPSGIITGEIHKNGFQESFDVHYEWRESYVLTWVFGSKMFTG